MYTGVELQAQIMQRASEDQEFRARLIADPKGVIEAETEAELPDDVLVFIQEKIAAAQKDVSPPDAPLTEDELIQVVGGGCPYYNDWGALGCYRP